MKKYVLMTLSEFFGIIRRKLDINGGKSTLRDIIEFKKMIKPGLYTLHQ